MNTKNLALASVSAATLGLLFGPAAVQASTLRPEIKSLSLSGSPNQPSHYIQSNNNRGNDKLKADAGDGQDLIGESKPEMLAALAETLE